MGLLIQQKQRDYQDLKEETLKVVRGTSRLNVDLLNNLIEETTVQMAELEGQIRTAEAELREVLSGAEQVRQEYAQLMDWAGLYDNCSFEAKKMIAAQSGSSAAMRWTLNLMFPLRNFRPFIWSRRVRKIGAPGLLLISPLWRNPGRLVENTPHLQDNRHFLFYPVSFPANKLHNKILFAKSALFVPFIDDIAEGRKLVVTLSAVHTIIHRNKVNIMFGKHDFRIHADLQIITSET